MHLEDNCIIGVDPRPHQLAVAKLLSPELQRRWSDEASAWRTPTARWPPQICARVAREKAVPRVPRFGRQKTEEIYLAAFHLPVLSASLFGALLRGFGAPCPGTGIAEPGSKPLQGDLSLAPQVQDLSLGGPRKPQIKSAPACPLHEGQLFLGNWRGLL